MELGRPSWLSCSLHAPVQLTSSPLLPRLKRRSVRSVMTDRGIYTSNTKEKWFSNVGLLSQCISSSATSDAQGNQSGKPSADGRPLASEYVMPQIVFYQDGIGASPYLVPKLVEGATGSSLDLKVQEAYSFIVDNYQPGDQLFFFGFSRGAYTARTLAALINYVGILSRQERSVSLNTIWEAFRDRNPSDPQTVIHAEETVFRELGRWPSGNAMYSGRSNIEGAEILSGKADAEEADQMNDHKDTTISADAAAAAAAPSNGNAEARFPRVDPPTIQVVGVFDTVGALGVPGSFMNPQKVQYYSFFDPMLAPNVRHAFHAMALAEDRKDFLPTIWALPKKELPADAKRRQGQELKQCWFQGSHSDVGGGHPWHGLSDITLGWMISQLVDRPNGQPPLLNIDLTMARRLQDFRLPWAMQPEHPSRLALQFQATRQVCGWTVPAKLDQQALWRDVIDREQTHESIHHSVVVGKQYDPNSSPQFHLLRQHDKAHRQTSLQRLWAAASSPDSLGKAEQAMRWSLEESQAARSLKVKDVPMLRSKKGKDGYENEEVSVADPELYPSRPDHVPMVLWNTFVFLTCAPLLALSFVMNWKTPILGKTAIPQRNLQPPLLQRVVQKRAKQAQKPAHPAVDA